MNIQQADTTRMILNSVNMNGDLVACSSYGKDAELSLFDIRFAKKKVVSTPVLNSHHKELSMKISPNKRFIALPNHCGTIRIYDYASLKPLHDFKCSKVDRKYFIPNCTWTEDKFYYTNYSKIDKFNIISNSY